MRMVLILWGEIKGQLLKVNYWHFDFYFYFYYYYIAVEWSFNLFNDPPQTWIG